MAEENIVELNSSVQDETLDEKINPLPRSVTRRQPFELLDGEWRFALDINDRGIHERWYVGHEYTTTTEFPGLIESHLNTAQGLQAENPASPDEVVAWYEREFSIPAEWSERPNSMTQVTFGACGYETRVWINGHPLKTIEGEEVHYGEYNSFSYELPIECLHSTNRLTVRIADTMDAEITRGKQASHVYRQGGIWYQTISGAVRSLWIEPVERNRLRSRLAVTSSVRDRIVQFDLTTRIHDPGIYRLRLNVTNAKTGESVAQDEFELLLEAGEKPQRVPLELSGENLWSPKEPNLYHLTAELVAPDGNVAGIETNFGIRKIEARGRSVYLNNEALYLDGILYQPGIATYDEMRKHFRAMKRLGCNLVRVHIAGIDPRLYDLADEAGLLLWVEVPSPHTSSQRSRENHRAELNRMLSFIAQHPSICIISLYNEDWGAQDIATNVETRRYIAATYNYLRLNLPQVLVVDNDGWNHVSRRGRLKSDLLTAHVYTPDQATWGSTLDRLVAGETVGVTAEPLVTGDPFFYRGQTPLIISEWGGFGFSMYGGPKGDDERAARIREFKRELRRRPIAGDVYTQATSIEEEENGILDSHTGELEVPVGTLDSSGLS